MWLVLIVVVMFGFGLFIVMVLVNVVFIKIDIVMLVDESGLMSIIYNNFCDSIGIFVSIL